MIAARSSVVPCYRPVTCLYCQPCIPPASYSSSASRRLGDLALQAVARTAYSYETQRLLKTLLTRQAVKTVLNYLGETNGELHFFLHNYLSEHPLPLAGETDADAWLVGLASSPYTTVSDPRRSSVPTVAAKAAVMQGERAVSPRDVADRIMGLREHIAQEMQEELGAIHGANSDVNRRALEKTMTDFTVEPGANAQGGE